MIVGQVSITNFPLWEKCLTSLSKQVDGLYLRYDNNVGDPKILEKLLEPGALKGKIKRVLVSDTKWNRWNWREEMIRMLDDVKPEIVISLDQDEIIEGNLDAELTLLRKSKPGLMVGYKSPMPTDTGEVILKGHTYPKAPHMKVFKWKKGLTYNPYQGYAQVTQYAHKQCTNAKHIKISHWCMYTKEMRDNKLAWLEKEYKEEMRRGLII